MSETTAQVNEERIMNDSRQAVMAFNARVNETYKNIVPYTPVEGRQSINQQQAEYILKEMNHPRQRKVNSSQVNTIIDKMLTGAWIDGHPITFAKCDGKFYLVNGQHRMMAIAKCGKRQVFSVIISNCKTPDDVHKIYCTHDLVRKENKPAQVAQVSLGGRGNKGGESEAARQLGLDRDDVRRAAKVASITPEAQQTAHEVGLADNRSALLEAASKPAEDQATYLRERAAKKEMKLAPDMLDDFEAEEKQYAAIVAAWNRAGQAARQRFLREHT